MIPRGPLLSFFAARRGGFLVRLPPLAMEVYGRYHKISLDSDGRFCYNGNGKKQKKAHARRGMVMDMDDILAGDVFLLTDPETNEDAEYRILGVTERGGKRYAAIVPNGEEVEEYVVLEVLGTGTDLSFVRIEDDDEWEDVAAYFDNEIFIEIDHDEV